MTPLEPDVLVRLRLDFDGAVESFRRTGDSLEALADALAELPRLVRSPARFARRHDPVEPSWQLTRAERRAERRRVALDLRREARRARMTARANRAIESGFLGNSLYRGGAWPGGYQ